MTGTFQINFDEEVCICAINWRIINNTNNFYIALIDSLSNKIKVCEIADNEFLIYLEKLIIQSCPDHENIKYHIIINLPFESFQKKTTELLEKFEFITSYKILIENKLFEVVSKNKTANKHKNNDNPGFNINLFLQEDQLQSNHILTSNDYTNSLYCFSSVADYFEMQKNIEYHNRFSLEKLNNKEFMTIDMICINSLNLIDEAALGRDNSKGSFLASNILSTESEKASLNRNRDARRKESVFSILNRCCSKAGVRLLRSWILQPLQDIDEIKKRQDITELFQTDFNFRKQIRDLYLSKIPDIQTMNFSFSKFTSKKDFNLITLETLAKLKLGLSTIRTLCDHLKLYNGIHKDLMDSWYVRNLGIILSKTEKLEELLNKSIVFDSNLREYIINNELNNELYELRQAINSKFDEIHEIKGELESDLSKNVKVHLEENANLGWVFYVNKVEGEKFINNNKKCGFILVSTNRAHVVLNNKNMESISYQIKQLKLDYKLKEQVFHKKIIEVSASYQPVLERLVFFMAEIDVLAGFATMISDSALSYAKPQIYDPSEEANSNNYNKNNKKLFIKNSRHIILEWNQDIIQKHNPLNKNLVENNCDFSGETTIKLITGMNMGGKSTYLKQIGISVILAHIGCFVPCEEAVIPLTDQIFTRMGAGDNPLKGISTFMNEMIEVSSMLNSATENSLLLIDEIGRGTSSDNGIGLSFGIIKFISERVNSYCLFATHFFELTKLVKNFENIKIYSTKNSLLESGEIRMEYKIVEGTGESSFGLNLMKLMRFDKRCIEVLESIKNEIDENN